MILILTAVIFIVLSISSAVLGVYASRDQGLDLIMYWFAVVSLGVAAGFTVAYLASRRTT